MEEAAVKGAAGVKVAVEQVEEATVEAVLELGLLEVAVLAGGLQEARMGVVVETAGH